MRTRGRGGHRPHWREWLGEYAETSILLFVMVTMFRGLFGAGSPLATAVASPGGRLVVDGAVSGLTVALLIISPFGRRSGGHMNPAVSVAFWLMGTLPGRDTAAYVAAQLAGSVTGVAAGRLVWGAQAAAPAVGFATIRASEPWFAVFVAEAGATAVMLAAVTFVAVRPRLAASLPAVAGTVIAALIVLLGGSFGGSFNPARQFGPELFSGDLRWVWVYLLAPLAGATAFGLLRSRLRRPSPACALCER